MIRKLTTFLLPILFLLCCTLNCGAAGMAEIAALRFSPDGPALQIRESTPERVAGIETLRRSRRKVSEIGAASEMVPDAVRFKSLGMLLLLSEAEVISEQLLRSSGEDDCCIFLVLCLIRFPEKVYVYPDSSRRPPVSPYIGRLPGRAPPVFA